MGICCGLWSPWLEWGAAVGVACKAQTGLVLRVNAVLAAFSREKSRGKWVDVIRIRQSLHFFLPMVSRLTTCALLALLLVFQYQTWLGPRSVTELASLRERLSALDQKNAELTLGNKQLQAEVDDLHEGLETVEEKARYELNMVKNGEMLVQYLD